MKFRAARNVLRWRSISSRSEKEEQRSMMSLGCWDEGDVPTRADPFEGRTDVETLSQNVFDLVLTFLPNFTSSLNTTDTEMVTKTLDIHVVDTNLHSLQLGLKSSFFLV